MERKAYSFSIIEWYSRHYTAVVTCTYWFIWSLFKAIQASSCCHILCKRISKQFSTPIIPPTPTSFTPVVPLVPLVFCHQHWASSVHHLLWIKTLPVHQTHLPSHFLAATWSWRSWSTGLSRSEGILTTPKSCTSSHAPLSIRRRRPGMPAGWCPIRRAAPTLSHPFTAQTWGGWFGENYLLLLL